MIEELILFLLKEGSFCFISSSRVTSDQQQLFLFSHRLFQVEYAIEAVKLGSTAVGIQTREGVILAIEKRLTSSLIEPSSVEKIMEIDSHIGAAVSGLIGGNHVFSISKIAPDNLFLLDGRTLIDHGRIEAQNHRFTYDEVCVSFLTHHIHL